MNKLGGPRAHSTYLERNLMKKLRKVSEENPEFFVRRINRFHFAFFLFILIPLFIELVDYRPIANPLWEFMYNTRLNQLYSFVYSPLIDHKVWLVVCFWVLAIVISLFIRNYFEALKRLKPFSQYRKIYAIGRVFSQIDRAIVVLSILIVVVPLIALFVIIVFSSLFGKG